MFELKYITELEGGVDLGALETLKTRLLDPDYRYFAVHGEGRSLRVGEIIAWQVKSLGKRVSVFGSPSFPDYDSLVDMQNKKKKMIFLPISGSGTTTSVIDAVQELRQLSDKHGGYLKIVAVTSFPDRKLAELAHDSIIISGRTKDAVEKDWFARQVDPEVPTMGDNFEEKSLLYLHATLLSAKTGDEISDIVKREIRELKTDLNEELSNGDYKNVKNYLARSHKWGVFCYGLNPSYSVAKMVANRMNHYDIQTYVIGETNTPGMGYGQLGFLFSASGKTEPLLKVVDKMREVGATVVAVIGNRNSRLEKKILEGEGAVLYVGNGEKGSIIPRRENISAFYFKAPVATNYMLRDLAADLGITEKYAKLIHE